MLQKNKKTVQTLFVDCRTRPLSDDNKTVLVVGGVHWLAGQHLDLIIKALKRLKIIQSINLSVEYYRSQYFEYRNFISGLLSEKISLALSSLPKDLVQVSISMLMVSITYQKYVSSQFHLFFFYKRAKIRVVGFCCCPIHLCFKKIPLLCFFLITTIKYQLPYDGYIKTCRTENYWNIIRSMSYIEVKDQNYFTIRGIMLEYSFFEKSFMRLGRI